MIQCFKIIFLDQQLISLDEKLVGQWRMYFCLKSKFYLAEVNFYYLILQLINYKTILQARAYQALDFLKKNDAPNALRSAEEASSGKYSQTVLINFS